MKRIFLLAIALLTAVALRAADGEFKENQQPLFIMEGRVVDNDEVRNIPSSDIESITIVKNEEAQKYAHLGDISNGVCVITLKSNAKESVATTAQQMPKFLDGGLETFQAWFMQNVRYPGEALDAKLEDNIIVAFTVDRQGYIDTASLEFVKIKHDIFKEEIRRVFALSPRWTPAVQDGETVALRFYLPVVFSL